METLSSAPSSPIRLTGPWPKSHVREFLAEARIPMRLAAITDSGFPSSCLWFLPEEDELLAAVHARVPVKEPVEQSRPRNGPNRQSGGGNRTAGSSTDSDDSRTDSRTGIAENTSKEDEQNALPDILMTMS